MSAKTAPGPACRGMSTAQGCTERAEECTHAEGLGMVVAATDDKRVNMLADMSNRKRIQETLARAFDWYATAVDARLRQRKTGARSFALLRRRGLMKAFGEWSKFLEQVKMGKKERHSQSRGMSFKARTEEICAHFSSLESPCLSSRAFPSSSIGSPCFSSSRKHLLLLLGRAVTEQTEEDKKSKSRSQSHVQKMQTHDTSPAPALSQGISSPRQSRGKSGGCWPQCFRWLAATKTSARNSTLQAMAEVKAAQKSEL